MKNKKLFMQVNLKKTRSILAYGLILLAGALMICFVIPQVKTNQNRNPNGRNDAWGFTGAGGGGAMFNPTVSPHNPSYAYVRCDMTGAYVTYNGGESWRMFNLRSPVRWFVFDPLDVNVIYANSIALFRSTDRGTSWSIVYPDPSEIKSVISKR